MGYSTNAHGAITVTTHFTQQDINNIQQTINEVFFIASANDRTYDTYNIYSNTEKYYEDDVLNALNYLIKNKVSGVIRYRGEDYTFWRFVFSKENGIKEQQGRIVYDD